MMPVFLGGAFGTASLDPQLVCKSRDLSMPEASNTVLAGRRVALLFHVSLLRVFLGLPGLLMRGLVVLLATSGASVGVGCQVLQFGGALVIFVVGPVVISSRHSSPLFAICPARAGPSPRWPSACSLIGMSPVDKASRKQKDANESEEDPRIEWEKEDQELEGRKPDLEEIEEDRTGL
jgi:hypothetical protein